MRMRRPTHDLDQVQRWMQSVIMHPDGVAAGIRSELAQQQINVHPEQVESVVCRSKNQTSIERLQVYANAYYARLLECLRNEFPAMAYALGQETFDKFGFAYLQSYPSTSYTLGNLGRNFPRFLAETRPTDSADGDAPSWPDFLTDLATVERTYSEVFDGPGIEEKRILQAEDLHNVSAEQWPDARLVPVPCLRLLKLAYPVHEYITAVRHGTEAVIPNPSPTHLVITRREYIVRRRAVSPVEYELLTALTDGETVGVAIERAASPPDVDLDALAAQLQEWFRNWAAAAYFQAVTSRANVRVLSPPENRAACRGRD